VNMSEKIDLLAGALVKVQGEMGTIPKDSRNPFFNSKYADLATVSGIIIPLLSKNGLSVSQICGTSEKTGSIVSRWKDTKTGKEIQETAPYLSLKITTILMHESGQWISGEMESPIAKNDPQGIGSAITYARRYSLMAIVAAVADEDDDGNKGSVPPHAPTTQKTPAPEKKPVDNVTKLHAIFTGAKISDEAYRQFLSGYNVESSKNLAPLVLEGAIRHASDLVHLLREYAKDGMGPKEITEVCKAASGKDSPFLMTAEEVRKAIKDQKELESFMDTIEEKLQ
jgi:hypothetical protein